MSASGDTLSVARADGYVVDTDRGRLDRAAIHAFLSSQAYWSPGIPRDRVDTAIEHSLCFGLYAPDGEQAGFARVVTDHAQFAWLADVYVAEAHRRRGLGVWLVEVVLAHPVLQRMRVTILGTADAHGLYRRFGFEPAEGDRYMVLRRAPQELWVSAPGPAA